jgi:hypothetical protein
MQVKDLAMVDLIRKLCGENIKCHTGDNATSIGSIPFAKLQPADNAVAFISSRSAINAELSLFMTVSLNRTHTAKSKGFEYNSQSDLTHRETRRYFVRKIVDEDEFDHLPVETSNAIKAVAP